LVLFTVIKYFVILEIPVLFLSNAQSFDTPVHQGNIGVTTRKQGQMQRSSPKLCRVKTGGTANLEDDFDHCVLDLTTVNCVILGSDFSVEHQLTIDSEG
jgi:hypothetical protein